MKKKVNSCSAYERSKAFEQVVVFTLQVSCAASQGEPYVVVVVIIVMITHDKDIKPKDFGDSRHYGLEVV